MILIDANVFMYAAGAESSNKAPSLRLLERAADGDLEAATDAEVLQEILHRYSAMKAFDRGLELYQLVRKVIPNVLPITASTMDAASVLMQRYPKLTARDAVHAAVCLELPDTALCTYDTDFHGIRGLKVLRPEHA